MDTKNQAMTYSSRFQPLFMFTGLLLGGLIGAGIVLLFAPQSGAETRMQIKQGAMELRDRTGGTVDETVAQLKSRGHQITDGLRGKTEEFQQQGQKIIVKQLDSVVAAAEAGKAAIQGS